jgi:serine/threonine protein kinase
MTVWAPSSSGETTVDTAYRVRPLRATDPERLGEYVLVGRLGAGGMGVVYLAESDDGSYVAVKLIHADLAADPEYSGRFRSEVERARQVPSFCTAEFLAADLHHDPPYLVVEYIDGPSLAEVVDERGPLRGGTLHSLAVGVATALTGIHGAGIIHRDLKPDNVLLPPGSPKVIDFGIARPFEATSQHTHPDMMVGTVAYMAPERFAADPDAPVTAAADVFAWGCVIAYAGTGRTPFRGDSPSATVARILSQPPHLKGLAEPMREPVLRALSKDPAERPTAPELLTMLLGGQPLLTRSSTGNTARTVPPPDPAARLLPGDPRRHWLEVHGVGGPASGRIWPVGMGSHDIGSVAGAAIDPGDPALGGRHARLTVDDEARAWVTVGPGDPPRLAVPHPAGARPDLPAEDADGARRWPVGRDLALGDSLFRLVRRSVPDADVSPATDGPLLEVMRPPRAVPPRRHALRGLPGPPVSRGGRQRYRDELAEYQRALGDLTVALERDRRARCEAAPDPAALFVAAVGPGRRLWERRRHDPDRLLLRVGTTDQPSLAEITDPSRPDGERHARWTDPSGERRAGWADPSGERRAGWADPSGERHAGWADPSAGWHGGWTDPDVPLTLDLADRGVIGLSGEPVVAGAVARWLLAQAAALRSPRDLRVHVLTEPATEDRWRWARALPHAGTAGVAELASLINTRASDPGRARTRPDVLVLLDGPHRRRDLPGLARLLTGGPAAGVFSICLDPEERLLPPECTAVVRAGPGGLSVRQEGMPGIHGVRPDEVTPDWCDRVARALATLRDITPHERR